MTGKNNWIDTAVPIIYSDIAIIDDTRKILAVDFSMKVSVRDCSDNPSSEYTLFINPDIFNYLKKSTFYQPDTCNVYVDGVAITKKPSIYWYNLMGQGYFIIQWHYFGSVGEHTMRMVATYKY